jgi:hypothetical protein
LLAAVAVGRVDAASVRPEDAAAVQVVDRFNDTMLAVLKDAGTLGYKGRFERLQPVLTDTFDLDFMAEKAIGRFWRTLSEACARASAASTSTRADIFPSASVRRAAPIVCIVPSPYRALR